MIPNHKALQRHRRVGLVLAAAVAIPLALASGLLTALAAQRPLAAPSAPSGITDLWGGAIESIALRADGTVWAWGWDEYGVLGNGHGVAMTDTSTEYDAHVPFEVLGPGGAGHLSDIQQIAGGERHNAALDADGHVWTWGWNYFGQLGLGTPCSGLSTPDCMRTTPTEIPGFSDVKAIAARGYHTLALKRDGSVWAWGYNNSGRLGDGTNVDRRSPVPIGGLSGHGGVLALSGGGDVSAALMADHTLMAWGTDANGAVGDGVINPAGQWTPVAVSQSTGLTDVAAIATGWDHMIALDADGNVWTWGDNSDGELGNGTTISSSLPLKVAGLPKVIGVSGGDGSTFVLAADHTLWGWGTLRHGDGTYYSIGASPSQVAGIDNVALVRARDWHVLALKLDGTVWAWGSNQRGEIGNNTVGGDTDSPQLVLFPLFLTRALFLPLAQR